MYCSQCYGNKTVKGQVTCPQCQGAGYIEHAEDCPKCAGYGDVDGGTCSPCGGSGYIDGANCGTCYGSGKAARQTCDGCNGYKKINARRDCPAMIEGDVTCPQCNGSGEAPDAGGGGLGGSGGSSDDDLAKLIKPAFPGAEFRCDTEHPNCPSNSVTLKDGDLVTEKHWAARCDARVTKNQYGVHIHHAGAQHHCQACGQYFGSA